jgi:VWFA-related protein
MSCSKWLATVALAASLSVAQEIPRFQTGISLVRVDAEATDGTRLLTGLRKEDFRIFDNGEPRPILYFSENEEPLDLILLFDISGSMRPKLEKVAAAAHAALAQLRRGDRVAVMVFRTQSAIVVPFTEDLDEVERGIARSVIGKSLGGTRILHAIEDAALYFLKQPRTERRRAILVVTDNIGRLSAKQSAVVRSLWEADALVSGLQVRSAADDALLTAAWVGAPHVAWFFEGERMTGVIQQTGGDLMKGPDPGAEFQESLRRIRLRYSLYYAMPEGKPGEQRHIRVTVRNSQVRVHAREGYFLPTNAPGRPAH